MIISREQLSRIHALVGAKYTEYGASFADGFDCFTLARHVLSILGQRLPELPAYTKSGADAAALLEYHQHFEPSQDVPGAIVALAEPGSDAEEHMGVLLPGGKLIHTRRATGVVIERLLAWRPLLRGCYRLKEAQP